MGIRRIRRIGRGTAERILSGAPVAEQAGLVRLLRQAAAPPSAQELAGHETMVRAMATAYRSEAAGQRRYSRLGAVSRAVAVKVASVAAVLLLGGTALAASTGNLPAEVQHGAHGLLSALGVPVPDADPPATPAPRPSRSAQPTTTPSPSPSPSNLSGTALVGLCRAWRAQQGQSAQSADPGVVQLLSAAAGGDDQIPALCDGILGRPATSPSPSRSPKPTSTKHASASPTQTHPGSSQRPTPAPTRHPSPKPS